MGVLFAGPMSPTKFSALPRDDGGEFLRMLGSQLGGDRIFRALGGDGLKDFLELTLRIHIHGLETQIFDVGLRFIDNEAADRLEATIEVHGPYKGLERVRERRGTHPAAARFLSFSHHQVIAEAN